MTGRASERKLYLRRMWTCGKCSSWIPAGTASCPSCGNEISRTPPARVEPGIVERPPVDAVVASPRSAEPAPPRVNDATMRQLRALLDEARVIEAIKLYREATGLGLKESMEAVNELRASR